MRYEEDLKAFVDQELPPLRMAEIQTAIDGDPELAAKVEALRSLSFRVRELHGDIPILGLEETLLRLQKKRFQRAIDWRLWVPVLTASVALVVIVGPLRQRTQSNSTATVAMKSDQSVAQRELVAPQLDAAIESTKSAVPTLESKVARPSAPSRAPLAKQVPIRRPTYRQKSPSTPKPTNLIARATPSLSKSTMAASAKADKQEAPPQTVEVASIADAKGSLVALAEKYPGVTVVIPSEQMGVKGQDLEILIDVPAKWDREVARELMALGKHPKTREFASSVDAASAAAAPNASRTKLGGEPAVSLHPQGFGGAGGQGGFGGRPAADGVMAGGAGAPIRSPESRETAKTQIEPFGPDDRPQGKAIPPRDAGAKVGQGASATYAYSKESQGQFHAGTPLRPGRRRMVIQLIERRSKAKAQSDAKQENR